MKNWSARPLSSTMVESIAQFCSRPLLSWGYVYHTCTTGNSLTECSMQRAHAHEHRHTYTLTTTIFGYRTSLDRSRDSPRQPDVAQMPQLPVVICSEHTRRTRHHRGTGVAAPELPWPYRVQINAVRGACGLGPLDFAMALPGQASEFEAREKAMALGDCTAVACVMLEHPGRRVQGRLSLQTVDEQIAFEVAGCPSDAAVFSVSRAFAFLDEHDWILVTSNLVIRCDL